MNHLQILASTLDRVYGLTNKPKCPVCNLPIPQPHDHCDACDSPHSVAKCGQEGCQSYFCEKCQARHAVEHFYDYRP